MSIDNIQLSGYLCQELYRNSIVEADQPAESNQLVGQIKIKSLGNNASHILFVVADAEHSFLADNEMKLLINLLSACNISMGDIALVNFCQDTNIDYKYLQSAFAPKKILSFGVTPAQLQLPFTIPPFQIHEYDEVKYLFNPALPNFQEDVELKKQLWNCLKKLILNKK